ncbi:MAG: AAA family ATPase [Mailhella sp.]|nr:AAA family ATPase [Mailhella sp.]
MDPHDSDSTFIVGQKNANAWASLEKQLDALRKGEGVPYIPIVIKGSSGSGKTHLLKEFSRKTDNSAYVSGRDFVYAVLESPTDLFSKIRDASLLCVDDVHFIFENEAAQRELCYVIDRFSENGQAVILAMSTESLGKKASPALESRMAMGFAVTLAEPDLDVRFRYVLRCFEERNIRADRDYALTVARLCQNLRTVKGTVNKIESFIDVTGQLPDSAELSRLLSDSGASLELSAETIVTMVGTRYGLSSKELKSKKRDQRIVEARQIAMYLCRDLLGESYPNLGKIFGGKDHSTVIYSVKKIEDAKESDKNLNILINELSRLCRTMIR